MSYLDKISELQNRVQDSKRQIADYNESVRNDAFTTAEAKKEDYLGHIGRHLEAAANTAAGVAGLSAAFGSTAKHIKKITDGMQKGKQAVKKVIKEGKRFTAPEDESPAVPTSTRPTGPAVETKSDIDPSSITTPEEGEKAYSALARRLNALPEDKAEAALEEFGDDFRTTNPDTANLNETRINVDTLQDAIKKQESLVSPDPADVKPSAITTAAEGDEAYAGLARRLNALPDANREAALEDFGSDARTTVPDPASVEGTRVNVDSLQNAIKKQEGLVPKSKPTSLSPEDASDIQTVGKPLGNLSTESTVESRAEQAVPESTTAVSTEAPKDISAPIKALADDAPEVASNVVGKVGGLALDAIPIVGEIATAASIIQGIVGAIKGHESEEKVERDMDPETETERGTAVASTGFDGSALQHSSE